MEPPSASDPAVIGQWSEIIALPNVPIHAHVLSTGQVLFWGRRNPPGTSDFDSLNQHECSTFIWDPGHSQLSRPTGNRPTDSQGAPINLFCSGHTFLPDGRLLVTGGHLFDGQGIDCATIYDPATDRWTAAQIMNEGRWYPTAVTLPDGSALVCSGSFATGPVQPPQNQSAINDIPQVWNDAPWVSLRDFDKLPLYPRLHVAPDGRLFMSGGLAQSFYFDTRNGGTWTPGPFRSAGGRDYAPSVMYDVGKVIFIGGGLDAGTLAPTNIVEIIDLNTTAPAWVVAAPMYFARRQHNATLLADGTVLVTGGTQGNGFNNLDPGQPVHTPELWDATNGSWQQLAPEAVDRCYHSTAVLLPDGRVLSAGGGEYAPTPNVSNLPKDTHSDAQIFSPPYLFKGARPSITRAPAKVLYGEAFDVETPAPNEISQITWIRLPSVTHSFDQNQRINFLNFQRGAGQLTVTAPANGNVCPPGHYMLFLLNQNKVPSIARIVQIGSAPSRMAAAAESVSISSHRLAERLLNPIEKDEVIRTAEKRAPVVVGITPTCPYGISACWAGAYEALQHLHGVRVVRPIPNAEDSTAYVYLQHDGLPNIDVWPTQFGNIANGIYVFRGVEVTVAGLVQTHHGNILAMRGNDVRPRLLLEPIKATDKIQWDLATGSLRSLTPLEQGAFIRLQNSAQHAGGSLIATVTGPLKKSDKGLVLEVREFSATRIG
jgi:galactose oxidase